MLRLLGSVRFQVILFTLLVVVSGNVTLNLFLTQNAKEMLILEKQEKIEKVGHYLVKEYKRYFVGEQSQIYQLAKEQHARYKGTEPKTVEDIYQNLLKQRIRTTLSGIIETSSSLFGDQGGAGFYIRSQNRIYGFHENTDHYPYQKLIATVPISNDGSFVWVEESYKDLDTKIAHMQQRTNTITIFVIGLILLFAFIFGLSFSNRIKRILQGLKTLERDLHVPIPPMNGELGIISDGINQLAQSLILSRTRSDLILNNASTAMISLDQENTILFYNKAALELLNLKQDQLSTQTIYSLLGPVLENAVNRTFENHHTFSFDHYPVRLPSAQKYFHIVITSHFDPEKKKTVLITLDDVTENVKLIREAEKNESLRMLGMFTTGIAHEIRNPLTSVKGFVQLLSKKVSTDSGSVRMIQLISREIDRLEELLKDLITYARPSKTIQEWVSLSELLNIIENLLKDRIQQRKTEFQILDMDSVEIYADQRKVHQVLFNLVLNAIQAVPIGEGIVTICTKIESDTLWICVQDNGYGIREEDIGKIFTPFFTTKDKGTGLGLAISRRMMEDMEGKISFESDTQLHKTEFRIGFSKWRTSS
jgi:two-component system sensor histidine kinase AtoS